MKCQTGPTRDRSLFKESYAAGQSEWACALLRTCSIAFWSQSGEWRAKELAAHAVDPQLKQFRSFLRDLHLRSDCEHLELLRDGNKRTNNNLIIRIGLDPLHKGAIYRHQIEMKAAQVLEIRGPRAETTKREGNAMPLHFGHEAPHDLMKVHN